MFKQALNKRAELGWQEIRTTRYIAEQLKVKPLVEGLGGKGTGLLYRVGTGDRAILLRADIDALKTSRGVAHTCGHSTHMASLMGTLLYTQSISDLLAQRGKSVYFLFQPAEETFPSGAHAFVAEHGDLLKTVSSAFAIHVRPTMSLGTIGIQPGLLWARGDYMEIEIRGKMVHVKNNRDGIDALYASALVIKQLHAIQNKYPAIRIGIGVASGGLQANTVADRAILKGDIRLPTEQWQKKIKKILTQMLQSVEKKTNAKIKLHYFDGTPPVTNDHALTNEISRYLSGQRSIPFHTIQSSRLFSYGCEDFAYIAQKVPSVMALIGTGDSHDLHEEKCVISDEGTMNAYS